MTTRTFCNGATQYRERDDGRIEARSYWRWNDGEITANGMLCSGKKGWGSWSVLNCGSFFRLLRGMRLLKDPLGEFSLDVPKRIQRP